MKAVCANCGSLQLVYDDKEAYICVNRLACQVRACLSAVQDPVSRNSVAFTANLEYDLERILDRVEGRRG